MKIFKIINLLLCLFFCFAIRTQAATIEFTSDEIVESEDRLYEIIFIDNGKIIAKRSYKNGKEIVAEGEIPRKIDNAIEVKAIRDSKGNVKEFTFYKNGQIINNDDGKRVPDGVMIEYYNDGAFRAITIHQNGKRQGPAIGFYQNGRVKVYAFYKDDYPEGIIKGFYENGQLKFEQRMINGDLIHHKEFSETAELRK